MPDNFEPAAPPPIDLIITADDLGYTPGVTRGILEAARAGVVASVALIVNLPNSAAAAAEAGELDLGLHLNLTRGRPLTPLPAVRDLVDRDGCFCARSVAALCRVPPDQLRAEISSQFEHFRELTGRAPTHVSLHRQWLEAVPLWSLLGEITLAHAPHAFLRARTEAARATVRGVGLTVCDAVLGNVQRRAPEPEWTFDHLLRTVAGLSSTAGGGGIARRVELVCHPGYAHDDELRSSTYSWQREAELRLFASPRLRPLLARRVRLTSFRELSSAP